MIIIMNKPVGYHATPTPPSVFELLDKRHCVSKKIIQVPPTILPTYELDSESEGLLILTDDKEKERVSEHEYEVTIDKYLSRQAHVILKKGINAEGKIIPGISIIEEKHKGKRSVVQLVATKATDIQIRILFETIGYHVVGIRRIRVGNIKLGVLSIGKWKVL